MKNNFKENLNLLKDQNLPKIIKKKIFKPVVIGRLGDSATGLGNSGGGANGVGSSNLKNTGSVVGHEFVGSAPRVEKPNPVGSFIDSCTKSKVNFNVNDTWTGGSSKKVIPDTARVENNESLYSFNDEFKSKSDFNSDLEIQNRNSLDKYKPVPSIDSNKANYSNQFVPSNNNAGLKFKTQIPKNNAKPDPESLKRQLSQIEHEIESLGRKKALLQQQLEEIQVEKSTEPWEIEDDYGIDLENEFQDFDDGFGNDFGDVEYQGFADISNTVSNGYENKNQYQSTSNYTGMGNNDEYKRSSSNIGNVSKTGNNNLGTEFDSNIANTLFQTPDSPEIVDIRYDTHQPRVQVPALDDYKNVGQQNPPKQYPWTDEVSKLLKNTFKLKSFRPSQEDIVNQALLGNDCFVLMPTGGGKSLCYQLTSVCTKGVILWLMLGDSGNHGSYFSIAEFDTGPSFVVNQIRNPYPNSFWRATSCQEKMGIFRYLKIET